MKPVQFIAFGAIALGLSAYAENIPGSCPTSMPDSLGEIAKEQLSKLGFTVLPETSTDAAYKLVITERELPCNSGDQCGSTGSLRRRVTQEKTFTIYPVDHFDENGKAILKKKSLTFASSYYPVIKSPQVIDLGTDDQSSSQGTDAVDMNTIHLEIISRMKACPYP